MDENAANPDQGCRVNYAIDCILIERMAETTSLIASIDGKAAEDCDRYWIGHVPAEPPVRRRLAYPA